MVVIDKGASLGRGMLMLIGRGIDATNAANTKLDMKTFKKLMLIKLQVTDEMNSGREKQIDDW